MNKEDISQKIKNKYGIEPTQLKDMSNERIKNLRVHHKIDKKLDDKFKLIKNPVEVLSKGAALGAGVAGAINTAFPNVIPVLGAFLTGASNLSNTKKVVGLVALASKPVDVISGPVIIGVGAAAGAVLYGGYRLVKEGISHLSITRDKRKAKKL